jgi:hypothetical protein
MMTSPTLMPIRKAVRCSEAPAIALGHAALHVDRPAHRVDHTGELQRQTMTRRLGEAAAVLTAPLAIKPERE